MAVLIKDPGAGGGDLWSHSEPLPRRRSTNGFKAQVVTFDRECCVL